MCECCSREKDSFAQPEDDMTSARGQNVSVLQLLGTDPLEPPAGRPNSSLLVSKSMNGKSLSQHSLISPLAGVGRSSLAEGFASSKSVVNSSSSSDFSRELSPVRWCDREVDGVYLGRAGWVQVQQRSLDDSKGAARSQNNYPRKHFTSGTSSLERREQNRPINLPLPSKRRGNHFVPSAFPQELEPVPAPSVTPILSPPPAFRDEGAGIEVSIRSVKQPFEDLRHLKSRFGADSEESSLASPAGTRSIVSLGSKQSYQFSQTKSLDENSLDGHFVPAVSLFNFHSFDNGFGSFSGKDFRGPEDKNGCNKCEEKDSKREENGFSKDYIGQEAGFISLKPFRQRKYQLNGKHSESCAYKARSTSSDSDNSSSSEDSDRCHQNSRRFAYKHSQQENLNGKHFNVKRSRSLQLSEERAPRELMLMSHSSSGRSWDRVSPESPTFQGKNENTQTLRNLHNVMVTVNGQSVPVVSSNDRSVNLLNKITTSEEEQKQLIREAEKEARVISEYLNRTRSRAAARNLLIHRYFNRPELPLDPNDVCLKSEPESLYQRSLRRPQSKPSSWTTSLPQEPQPEMTYSKPFPRTFAPTTPEGFNDLPHFPRQATDPRSKRTQPPLLQAPNPTQKPRSKLMKNRNAEKPERAHVIPQNHGRHYQSSSTSSSSEDVREDNLPGTQNISSGSDLSLDCICLEPSEENSKAFRSLLHSRSASAPETDDYTSAGFDQKSLSLPRSFLSDRLNCRRNSVPWRQEFATSPGGQAAEWAEKPPASRTVPTTPVRELRDDRSTKPPNRVKRHRLSRMSLLGESTTPRPRRIEPKLLEKSLQRNTLVLDRRTKLSDIAPTNSQDSTLKFSRRASSCRGSVNESENDSERTFPLESPLIYSLTAFKSDCKPPTKSFRQAASGSNLKKERRLRNGAFSYDKYDSYDSGIQIGIRGNIDSSESQDTDLQEDTDNLFLGSLHRGTKISSLVNRKAVRRTKSDLGGSKMLNWDVKNQQQKFSFNNSSLRNSKTIASWQPLSPEDSALLNRSTRLPFRRSLSLNELFQFEKPKPSKPYSEDEKNLFGATSDDDLLSDSESSVASLNERKKSSRSEKKEGQVILAEAVWDHVAMEPFELPFRAGDVIEVLDTRDPNWWWGATETICGYFPSAFVRLRVSQENAVEDGTVATTPAAFEPSSKTRRSKTSVLTSEQVRSSVVRELINTEREFVKILRDVKEGYIIQCRRRPDMFTSAQISTIFSNLEEILVFQEQFLKDLERRIDQGFPHKSCVGEAFLNHSSGFRMYSEYCNSHPMAMATLQELCQKNNYCKFFEMCRLKQNLIEIPLDGYLLTPVQRICKYPLQLAELLKYTKPDHPDFGKVEKALETMRSVAMLINERKRKMESLEKLAAWQQRVEGWEGEDLIELSSQLIYQGDVVRITSGMWTTNITLFLFDHQIIYCKRDLLKRNHHIYKGRICLDESEVVDLPDGKNQQLGVTVKYGIKICSNLKEKWLVFCCRSSEEKMKWLEALAEEKRLVAQDKEVGLELPATAKQLADMAARTKKIISSKHRGKNKIVSSYEEISQLRHSHLNSPKVKGRRMGTWFTFGGVMKSPKTSLRHRNSHQQVT